MIETTASKSFAEERSFARSKQISPLLWLNLVCLDAPLVAVTWQALFARSFGIRVAPGTTATLFLTAWLIYLADRFGDNLLLGGKSVASLRQEFCRRHRHAWLIAIGLIAIAGFVAIATQLDPVAVSVGSIVGFTAALYLLVNRFRPSLWRVLPLKEISIGFIFAAGTMVGLLRSLTSAALAPWILFASLCAMNCICIAVWERGLDLAQQRISIATAFPGIAVWLVPVLGAICLTSALLAFVPERRWLCLTLFLSAALLAAVHIVRYGISSDVRTALADLVLLTPLLSLWS